MERLKLLILTLVLFPFVGKAQIEVTDPQALYEVLKNTAMQTMVEESHNLLLDSIKNTNNAIMEETLAMSLSRLSHHQALGNADDFGAESSHYKQIASIATDIVNLSPQILTAVQSSRIVNKALVISQVSDLVAQSTQLVTDFVIIVNNGISLNPMAAYVSSPAANDSHNLLDRSERLELANSILAGLRGIRHELSEILFYAQYGSWGNLIHEIDPTTYYISERGKDIANDLINQWKKTKF